MLRLVSMGDGGERRSSLPHPRATALFARTIYRELRRAGYDDEGLLRFASELMEVITTNLHRTSRAMDPVSGVLDPETGLPNRESFEQIVDFAGRRADELGVPLLLMCVEVEVPIFCSDDVSGRVHERTARALRSRLRQDDVVARLPPNRYVVLAPRATSDILLELCARFGAALHEEATTGDGFPSGTRTTIRWTVSSGQHRSGAELIDQCIRAPAIPLGVVEDDHPRASLDTARLSSERVRSSDDASDGVVLALGGGAVRAGAHVGVIDVLAEAGIDVGGIAGTGAGALVGAMLLTGRSPDEIVRRFAEFPATPLFRHIKRLYAAYERRAKRTRPARWETAFRRGETPFVSDAEICAVPDETFAEFIEHFVGRDREIGSMSRPFAASAMDLVEGRPAVFTRGPLHQALRAACAVPGLFAPQRDGDRLLVDGSPVTELPIPAALALHLDLPLLGVYLERTSEAVPSLATSAEIHARTAALVRTELLREQLRGAPLVLTVPVHDVGWLDFGRAWEMRRMGQSVTRLELPRLRIDLDRRSRRSMPAAGGPPLR